MAQGTRTSTPSGAPRRHRARHGKVVSQAPGRLRVRLHREHRGADGLADIEQELAARDGVESVATNPRTGSLLVHYDHLALSTAEVTTMLHDLGVVADEVLGGDEVPEDLIGDVPEHSSAATGLLGALDDLDRRVSRLTGGHVDLKLLVPAGLGVIGLRQVMTTGFGLAEVPAYLLLWYAFDTFYKLHQRRTLPVGGPDDASAASMSSADPGQASQDGAALTPAQPTNRRRRSGLLGDTPKGRA
jgi:hypothetical protein